MTKKIPSNFTRYKNIIYNKFFREDFFMDLIYKVKDRPGLGKTIVFAFQQVLAILAATIAVPTIVGNGLSQASALFGAGIGTLVYLLFTKFRSPVFLGSSFAFIGSMFAAFAGAASAKAGLVGIMIGAAFAGLVYIVIAIIVKLTGVKWINKVMPVAVIGPTVSIIGLSLAGNAVSDLTKGKVLDAEGNSLASPYISLLCGLITLFVVILCSVYGKKMAKLIPFIIGILTGYAAAAIFTVIGIKTNNVSLQIIDFSAFAGLKIFEIPNFTFYDAIVGGGFKDINAGYIATVAFAYVPVAFVVFAEHIADHKNLSSIIGSDLTEDPGLHRTLLGDGVGSVAGAIFGGCPNTTYGESVGCVAITKNASVVTILTTAIMCLVISFFGPFVTFLASIPNCVMGGVCMTLYGFIAVSGLKMIQDVDLNDNANLFTVAVILISGIGGLTVSFSIGGDHTVTLTAVACALILGIIVNAIVRPSLKKKSK